MLCVFFNRIPTVLFPLIVCAADFQVDAALARFAGKEDSMFATLVFLADFLPAAILILSPGEEVRS
jgi:hypothetical protein